MSKALALDPNYAAAHVRKAWILRVQGRLDEAIAEDERALALDPAAVDAYANMGYDTGASGNLKRASKILTRRFGSVRTIHLWIIWYAGKAAANFGLKQYDQAIEWARRAIAIDPNSPYSG